MVTLSEIRKKRPFTRKQAWARVYITACLYLICLGLMAWCISLENYGFIPVLASNALLATYILVISPSTNTSSCFRAALGRDYMNPVFEQRETDLLEREDRIVFVGGVGVVVGLVVFVVLLFRYLEGAVDGVHALIGAIVTGVVATIGVFKLLDSIKRLVRDIELYTKSESYLAKHRD